MKVAVLSDIHGNYHALENCLQDAKKRGAEIRQSELMEYAPFWSRSVIHVLRTGKISQGTALNKAMEIDEYKSPWFLIPDECWEKALEELGIS